MVGLFQLNNDSSSVLYDVPVISSHEIPYFFYLHIPNYQKENKVYELSDVSEIKTVIKYGKLLKQDKCRPWISIETRLLDMTVGLHVYQLSFVNTILNHVFNMYFAYNIQDSNLEKPYIYMNREEES